MGQNISERIRELKGLTTPGELAEMLNVSWKTVAKWIKVGGLPAAKITGSWWIQPDAAADWFEKRFAAKKREQK